MTRCVGLIVSASLLLAATGAAEAGTIIVEDPLYKASSDLVIGAVTTIRPGTDYELTGYAITDEFQINLLYQAGVLQEDIDAINHYWQATGSTYNFGDNEEYLLNVSATGGLTIYEFDGLAETVGGPEIKWTITGWHQTILAGDIIDNGDGTITLKVLPEGIYRPFVNDPPVNNVEVFDGDLNCEVLGYTLTGDINDIGPGAVLSPTLVHENSIASSTMIFEGTLTANGDGSYSGTIAAVAGSYYMPGGPGEHAQSGGTGGFDIFAEEGGTAYYDDAVQGVIGANHDAYSKSGGWGAFYDPDVADYYHYELTLSSTSWYLRYNGQTLGNGNATPMSGAMNWDKMYATEDDTGAYLIPPADPDANDGDAAANGGGAQAWDMDWTWGSEVIPLQFPGFRVTVTDLSGGQYRVVLAPAPSEVWVDDDFDSSTAGWGITHFDNIQDAIDAVAGSTVHVANGLYIASNTTIDKSITLIGESRDGVVIAPAAEDVGNGTSTFDGDSQQGLMVVANDVTIQDLTIDGAANNIANGGTLPDHNNFRVGILNYADGNDGYDNLTIENVGIRHIRRRGIALWPATTGGHIVSGCIVEDISVQNGIMSAGAPVTITGNTISKSGGAIGLYPALPADSGVTITVTDNTIFDTAATWSEYYGTSWPAVGIYYRNPNYDQTLICTGNNITVGDGDEPIGVGATGMYIYNADENSVIADNTIDTTNGTNNWGIYLGGCAGTTVQSNTFVMNDSDSGIYLGRGVAGTPVPNVVTGNTFTSTGSSSSYISEGCALVQGDHGDLFWMVEIPYDTANIITNNKIDGFVRGILLHSEDLYNIEATISGNSITNSGVAAIDGSTLPQTVDASANYYGVADPASVGSAVSGAVDYTPWLTGGTDLSPGFMGDLSVLHVDDDSPQTGAVGIIQEAVNLVSGSTIHVTAGTYEEQVVIEKTVDLLGAGKTVTTIQSPTSLVESFATGTKDNYPIVLVRNSSDVRIEGFTVDGMGRGNGNYRFTGVGIWNADCDVIDCAITGLREEPLSGTQHGVGIHADNDTGGPYTITVADTEVDDYQKTGIALFGDGLTASVTDSTTTGSGALGSGLPAQNGIQIGAGANGSVAGCTIADHMYTAGTWAATGMLVEYAAVLSVTDTVFTDNYPAVYLVNTPTATFADIKVSNQDAYSGDGLYAYNESSKSASGKKQSVLVPSSYDHFSDVVTKGLRANMDVQISNSTFAGHDGSGSWGVAAFASGSDQVKLTVTDCAVKDWDLGIVSYDYGGPVSLTANYNQIFDNVSYGLANTFTSTVVDAENNYWGDASGPADSLGTDEAGNPPCYEVADMANADGLGDPVTDANVDYCPWLGAPAIVTLTADDSCNEAGVGGTVVVTVELTDVLGPNDIVGGDFFLSYDNSILDFVSIAPGSSVDPTSPFEYSWGQSIDEVAGTINYYVGIALGGSGTTSDSTMAVITFEALDEVCDTADLVSFRPHSPETKLSDQYGGAVYAEFVDLAEMTIDATVPVVSALTAIGGDADEDCEYTVTFEAEVTDLCCVLSDDVVVDVSLLTGNAILGTPTINKVQTSGTVVTITGDVLVSSLTSCPATVQVTVDADDCCGNSAVQASATADVEDNTAPVFDAACPLATITVPADAGECDAEVTFALPTATDNCDAAPVVTCDWPSGSVFPTGTTQVTCTAEDSCGNTTDCGFDVVVQPVNEMAVTVALDGSFVGKTFDRCITFELSDCVGATATEVVDQVLTFVDGVASGLVEVPCGLYDCVTARDKLHTLRRTDETFTISGTQYVASFTGDDALVGGNLNDDEWIDILDFGGFTWQWNTNYGTPDTTCGTASPHADLSGDGIVDNMDFSFIQSRYLYGHEADCCAKSLKSAYGREEDGPITEISVSELRRLGLNRLVVADLNRDGMLDQADVAAFMQGVRPQAPREERRNHVEVDRSVNATGASVSVRVDSVSTRRPN